MSKAKTREKTIPIGLTRAMSGIDAMEEDMTGQLAESVPWQIHKGRFKPSQFQVTKELMATPKRFRMAETPRARRLHFEPDMLASVEEDDNPAALASLTGRLWKVFRLSPLFRFDWKRENVDSGVFSDRSGQFGGQKSSDGPETPRNHGTDTEADARGFCNAKLLDPEFLPKLEDYLERRMETSVIRDWVRTFRNTHEDTAWKVKVQVIKGLRGHREDSDALNITVSLTTKIEKKTRKKKKNEPVDSERLLATVFMVGVDAGELTGLSSRLIDSTVVLPCCLSNGDTTVTTALFEALEKRFDTQIQPIEFLPRHLQWMLAMWSMLDKNQPAKKPSSRQADENGSARAEECAVPTPPPPPPTDTDDLPDEVDLQPVKNTFSPHVDLVYGLPEVMTDEGCGVRLLELQFPRKVMEGIRKRAFHTDQLTETEVDSYKAVLEKEISSNLKVNLAKYELRQIRAPAFVCKATGLLRIERPDKVKTVLSYLSELCQGSMRTPYPKLSKEEDSLIGESSIVHETKRHNIPPELLSD